MTYLAPRQGLFAIIILVSFCLQTLLLVISTDQQLTKSRAQKGEQIVIQLIDEARLSLENKDRVSLSVIANRYTSEQDIARLVITDNSDNVLVTVGNAPLQQGDTIRQIVTKGDAVIGNIVLTLKDISNGEIIALQWPFVIGSLIFHLLLWVAYGYIARPTKEQLNTLSRDIENVHREQYKQGQLLHTRASRSTGTEAFADDDMNDSDSSIYTGSDADSSSSAERKASPTKTTAVHSKLNAYLKSQQKNGDSSDSTQSADTSVDASPDISSQNSSPDANNSSMDSRTTQFTSSVSKLSASRAFDSVNVQIKFHDEYNMLERLAPEMRMPYLALCTQLLNQAVSELLKLPLLAGVNVVNNPRFSSNGACALLKADNEHAKVALAGVMLAKLYLMLNKIIHDKHIELSRFALPAKAGVSDDAQANAMIQLLKSVGKKEQLLILLPNAGLKEIGSHVQVHNIKRPTTVYERECAVFDGGNDAMIQRLADVRNAVLMSGNEEA